MAKSKQKKIERLEGIVVGAGFLLRRLKADFGDYFSHGTAMQVDQCLRDCAQVEHQQRVRKEAENAPQS